LTAATAFDVHVASIRTRITNWNEDTQPFMWH
jgi:hypothetical protein